MRAIPFDAEVGQEDETILPVRISPLWGEIVQLGTVRLGNEPRSIAAADFDDDGDIDLVTANSFSSNLTVFFQTAPRTFGSAPLTLGNPLSTIAPFSVAAADLDRDGDRDIVSANAISNSLTIFFQRQPGTFDSVPLSLGNATTTDTPVSVAAADFDGDGAQDLLCANQGSDSLALFFQGDPGTFDSEPLIIGSFPTIDRPNSVAAADLDGDGDADLVSANFSSDTLSIFFQVEPRSFDPDPLTLGGPSTTNGAFSVISADLDRDGDLDLVSANLLSDSLTIFAQGSPGVFDAIPLKIGDSATTNSPELVSAADFDGDGNIDLLSVNRFGDALTVFFQREMGSFDSTPLSFAEFASFGDSLTVAIADLDGDGGHDLITSDSLRAFFHSAPGTFGKVPTVLQDRSAIDSPISVVAADLDADGDLDLASANQGSDTLTVFFQNGPGAFDLEPLVLGNSTTTNSPNSVVAADLDGNGGLDLVSANGLSNNLTVFFQEQPGVFDSTPLVLGGSSFTKTPSSVQAADLDGDGDLDLISANSDSHTLTIFRQIDRGLFDSLPTVIGNSAITQNPVWVHVADIDSDGDNDLVSANAASGTLTVFFQTNPGVFDPTALTLGSNKTIGSPAAVIAADLNSDGLLDLASANIFGDTLTVFFQNGDASFNPSPLVVGRSSETDNPHSVAAVDLDGDGDLELVSPSLFGNTLTAYTQRGPATFAPTPTVLGNINSTYGPWSLVGADLDGDGDSDLVSANYFADTLTVFWNLD